MSQLIKRNGALGRRNFFPRSLFSDDFFVWDWPKSLLEDSLLSSEWIPSANVKETDDKIIVELSTPGYAKKDIHVTVDENNLLQITGEQEEESKEERENYTRREFHSGSFSRTFSLPENVQAENISAESNNGVLRVELPKIEISTDKKKVKEIQIA